MNLRHHRPFALSLPLLLLFTALPAQQPGDELAPSVVERPEVGCHLPSLGPEATFLGNTWPNGTVPYLFASNTTSGMRSAMQGAMGEIEKVADIDFVPRSSQADYLYIRDANGNSSAVGRIGGGQTVNIYNWNIRFVMVHELVHALGFWHEHQRPDRNTYVQINWGNIVNGAGGNFQVVTGAQMLSPYDFDSVMHYSGWAFSRNGLPTITVLAPNQSWQTKIGQHTHLSQGDISGLVQIYGQAAPPTLSGISPSTVTSYQAGTITLTGSNFDNVTRINVGPLQLTQFNRVSSTRIDFTPPEMVIGNNLVSAVNGNGSSNALILTVTGNDPPVLEAPFFVLRGYPAEFSVHSGSGWSNLLFASPDLVPSTLPGVVQAGIGNSFQSLFGMGTVVADPTGTGTLQLTLPQTVPNMTLHFQGVAFDPNNLTLPLPVTNTVSVNVF